MTAGGGGLNISFTTPPPSPASGLPCASGFFLASSPPNRLTKEKGESCDEEEGELTGALLLLLLLLLLPVSVPVLARPTACGAALREGGNPRAALTDGRRRTGRRAQGKREGQRAQPLEVQESENYK